jgi:hypothetical protein
MKGTNAPKKTERGDQDLREVMYPLILQAIKDTSLWLSIKPQVEEKVYILRAQARLNELARICERDLNYLPPPPRTNAEWNQLAAEVVSLVKKAVDVRKSIVGSGLSRLMELLAPPTNGEKQLPKQAGVRRHRVEEFLRLVLKETDQRVTKKDIALVAGYKDPTEFGRYQREDDRTTASAKNNFDRVLNMDPVEFVRQLEGRKRKTNKN